MRLIVFFLMLTAINAYAGTGQLIVVNGGGSSDANFSIFEDEILDFAKTFDSSKTNITIFNASGEENTVVSMDHFGVIKRNSDGSYITEKRKSTGLIAKSKGIYSSIVDSSGEQPMTLLFSDHGWKMDLTLWHDSMSYEKIRKAYQKLPKNKLIREIHDHCYSGSALVDPNRKHPNQHSEINQFLNKNYPQNRCGLALANYDELGYTSNMASIMSVFNKKNEINNYKYNSLKDIAEKISPTNISSVYLKSDYLLEDATEFTCKVLFPRHNQNDSGPPCLEQSHNSNFSQNLKSISGSIKKSTIENLCQNHTKCLDKSIRLQAKQDDRDISEFNCTKKVIETISPKVFNFFIKISSDFSLRDRAPKEVDKFLKEYDNLKNTPYVKSKIDKCISDNHLTVENIAKDRANCLYVKKEKNRQLLVSLFEMEPLLKPWKERYENLDSCEKSDLR